MSVAVPVVDIWDGENRRIYLKQGVEAFHWIDDIYKEYRYWRRTTEAARVWSALLRGAGNNSKGGGKYTPRYITLLDGTRVVPYDENILIVVTGEAITDNADVDPDPFDTSTRTQPLKLYITPPASELVVTSGGSGLTPTESAQLGKVSSIKSKTDQLEFIPGGGVAATVDLITEEALAQIRGSLSPELIMLLEIYALHGLDPTKPLIVNQSGRQAGEIHQGIHKAGGTVMVQRE